MSYYNTTNLSEYDLEIALLTCERQEEKIFLLFKAQQDKKRGYTPAEMHKLYCAKNIGNVPLTSIRRAMTNLSNDNRLEKSSEKRIGEYGKDNYVWTLKEK